MDDVMNVYTVKYTGGEGGWEETVSVVAESAEDAIHTADMKDQEFGKVLAVKEIAADVLFHDYTYRDK